MLRAITNMFLSHIKSIVRPLLRLHPRGDALAKHIRFQVWRLKARMVSHSKQIDVNKTYWLNPHNIEYALTEPHFNKYGDMGKITGGSWDLKKITFTNTDVYRAFHAHFIDNQPWESTPFYHRVLKEIRTGSIKWECNTTSGFDARLKTLNSLYEDIKDNGYKPQQELFHIHCPGLPSLESIDEIAVRIGRDGDILLQDGRHRLAIAKLLNLPQVPVKITVRHFDWYHFRNEILSYARANGNKVYQPLTHIDLQDIPAAHGEKRYATIKSYLPEQRGTLLDLGAHWGYFCHKCEEEGFTCCAIENDIKSLYFLKRLKRAENRQFEVIEESILDYKSTTNFSVVLALNIFHHFLKHEETYYKLIGFLRNLKMELMFFEPHLSSERQMMGAYKNFESDEFVDFVLGNSELNHSKLIGFAEDERPIYMLYK